MSHVFLIGIEQEAENGRAIRVLAGDGFRVVESDESDPDLWLARTQATGEVAACRWFGASRRGKADLDIAYEISSLCMPGQLVSQLVDCAKAEASVLRLYLHDLGSNAFETIELPLERGEEIIRKYFEDGVPVGSTMITLRTSGARAK